MGAGTTAAQRVPGRRPAGEAGASITNTAISGPNVVTPPNLHDRLDFAVIESACGLEFDDATKNHLTRSLERAYSDAVRYLHGVPQAKIRDFLSRCAQWAVESIAILNHHADSEDATWLRLPCPQRVPVPWLVEKLRASGASSSPPGRLAALLSKDSAVARTAIKQLYTFLVLYRHPEDRGIADVLARIHQHQREWEDLPRQGRDRIYGRAPLLRELHQVYRDAGGAGLGASWDPYGEAARGPFLAMVCECDHQMRQILSDRFSTWDTVPASLQRLFRLRKGAGILKEIQRTL